MEIENKKATTRAKILLIRLPLLAVLIVLVLTLMEVIPTAFWLIISAGVFLATLLVVLIGRLHYARFIFTDKEVTIRFYHLFPLITDYQEILVQRSDNPSFSIKKSFLSLIPLLRIKLHTSQGSAVYPSIPLSLFSKEETDQLMKELNRT